MDQVRQIKDIKPVGFFKKLFTRAYSEEDVHLLIDNITECNKIEVERLNLKEKCERLQILCGLKDKTIYTTKDNEQALLKQIENNVNSLKSYKVTVDKLKSIDVNKDAIIEDKTEEIKELKIAINRAEQKHSEDMKSKLSKSADDILKMDKKLNKDTLVTELKAEITKLKTVLEQKEANEALDKITRGKPKLTCPQVYDIKSRIKSKQSISSIADAYDVSTDTINRIKNGTTYKHCK